MTDLPTLPKAAYSLDLNDGHPVVAYSVQQMYDFARAALAREQEAQPAAQEQSKPVLWVARAKCDSENTVVGELSVEDISEKQFEMHDPDVWECIPLYTHPAQPAAQEPIDAKDAARWRMLPAFFEEYQIDAMKLYRDIDEAIAAQPAAKEPEELLREWIEATGVNPELNRWHVSREDVLQLIRAARSKP